MANNADKIRRQREEAEKAIRDSITMMGVEAKNFFIENFDKQGFDNEGVDAWEKRVDDEEPGRKILIKTGDLRRSIKVTNQTTDSVTIGAVDNDYAKYINEGTEKMVARPFMGNSQNLMKLIYEKIDSRIKKVFGSIK